MKPSLLVISLALVIFCFCLEVSAGKRLFEQSCNKTLECDDTLGFTCQMGKCKCAPGGETVYAPARRRCVGAAGRECFRQENETFCVENALCQDYEYMHLCTCKDTFYQSKDGNCYTVAKYGELCQEEDFSCGDSMTTSISCIERKCRCILGEENQFYDGKEKKCISYAGGQCIFQYSQSCVPNAKCDSIYENINGALFHVGHKCLCERGHTLTQNRQCLATYNTECNTTHPCNYDEFLGCLNAKCRCRNPLHEKYNYGTGQCSLLVGSYCKANDGPKCVDNAECVNSTGKCECSKGYSVTPLNTCLLDVGKQCEPHQCNLYNGLACVNDTCQCLDSKLRYDKDTKSCVSLAGSPCGTINLFEELGNQIEIFVKCETNTTCEKVYGNNTSFSYSLSGNGVCRIASATN